MLNPVEHLYKDQSASTEPDDLAHQVLWLTRHLKQLQGATEQFDDVYDTIEKVEAIEPAQSSNLSGGYGLIMSPEQQIETGVETALKFRFTVGSTNNSPFSHSTVSGVSTKITIAAGSPSDMYLFHGEFRLTISTQGPHELKLNDVVILNLGTLQINANSEWPFATMVQGSADPIDIVFKATQNSSDAQDARFHLWMTKLR